MGFASRPRRAVLRSLPIAVTLVLGGLAVAARAGNEATLEVVRAAALEGREGLRVTFDGRAGTGQRAFLVDESPAAETTYRAVFWFDANGLTMATGDSLVLFEGVVRNPGAGPLLVPAFRLHLRKASAVSAPRLVGELVGEDRSRTLTPAVPVPLRGKRRIQVEWRAATAAGAEDGLLRLSILGKRPRAATAPGVASASQRLLAVRLGVVGEVDPGSRGSFFLDGFESYRTLAPP